MVAMPLILPLLASLLPSLGQERSSSSAVLAALQSGGCVLVMRHASSPRETPTAATARPDNTGRERQLDDAGRRDAAAMGDALRALRIPIGTVLTSPTYRARETVTLGRLGTPTIVEELGDGGQSMQGVAEKQAAWLRERATQKPASGNTLLVTHQPNIARAFPEWGMVADGETVVLKPDGAGGAAIVGRVRIDEWGAMK